MEAPISASHGAMRSVLSKLNLLLEPEYRRLRKGQKDKIRLLQRDLEDLMSKYFIEPSDVEVRALTAECWVKQVRELSYDIDDFLDKLLYDDADATITVARKIFRAKIARLRKNPKPRTFAIKTCHFKIARLRKYLKPRRQMTDEISEFRSRVEEAIQQHWIYNLDDCSDDRPLYPPPHWVETAPLVGIDRPKNKLHEWLTNDEEKKLMVVSIVGPGGVGKTTLANELYKLGGRFECRAYVRTSRKPDLRRLLTSMLSQIRRHQRVETSGVHDLMDNIRQHLRDKRYFVIIDDLWALSTWDIVSRALPDSNRCSRILITTEFDIVAQACCGHDSKYIFKMEPLSEDGSRELFFNRVFGRQHKCPEKLNEVSYEIIRKCGGFPLATLTISSLLPRPPWENMEQHWNYVQNYLSYSMRTDPTLEGMKQVLNLSYNNLPHRLKACMLYLSLYQEDYIICKDDLVKQWIAEGFIEGKYMEEVAWSYFDELINRGMIQPVYINYNGEVLSCTVHYMILNLIRYKSIEENFITAIDHSQTTIRLADKVRRLALHFGNVEDVKPPANMRLSQVRSLAFYGLFKCMPSIIEFKLLRVLFLNLWVDPDDMSYDLTEISTLFRLTYLHIDACLLRIELPAQMQRLKGLVTLKIAARVSAIPSDIVHLPGLLHLSLPSGTNLPNGICHMTSLRTLGYFDLSSNSIDNVESLGKLTNLRELQLTCSTILSDNLESNMQRLGSILGKLSNLESLSLLPAGSSYVNTLDDPGTSSMSISCDGLSTVSPPLALLQRIELLPRYCIFSNLPEWIGELSKLSILKIAIRKLSMADIAILKGLTALTTLSLYVQTAPLERIVFDKAGFSVLKYFKFRCSVPWLKFEADAMPNLWKLKLGFNAHGVNQHGTIPISIQHLSGVKEISAKIGGAGADAESALASAVSNHPSNPRINVQLVDWIFYGEKGKNMVTQEQERRTLRELDEIFEEDGDGHYGTQDGNTEEDENRQAGSVATQQHEHGTLEEQYEILEEDPDEYYKTADEDSGEDENKQADSRISRLSESSSCLPVPGWAMKAAGWVVSPIISKLVSKGLSYLSFDASDKLKQLEIKVVQLELMLGLEAVKISPHRNCLEPLLKSLKSAFYEAEDILDDVEYHRLERQILSHKLESHAMLPRLRNWVKKLQAALLESSQLKKQESGTTSDDVPPDMSKKKLKKILEKIENIINEACKVLQLLNLPSHNNVDKRQTVAANPRGAVTTAAPPPVVIGRDEDRDKIIAMLHETIGDGQIESNCALSYSIIGIHGIPGSGKSTLAQYVCAREKKDKQEEKEGHFDLVMWVHVSQNFSVHTILSEMIEQAIGKPCPQFKGLDEIQNYLKDELYGKLFLLVLDDVWYNKDVRRQQELQHIVHPLEVGKAGSKILVTSRTSDASLALGAVRCIPMPDLDEDAFLELFMHYALEGARIDDQNRRIFEMIGADIAKKLKRSPLAARAVGGQLRIRPKVEFWRSVRDRDILNETMGALWWSYHHLDEQVRRCFAYCSIFPRRHRLERDKLVNFWVAEGFIMTTEIGEEMEGIAQDYFDELVSTSFLQLGGKNYQGRDYYTIHDLLHDLAEKVAGSDCFRIENGWTGEVPRDVRHLFITTCNRALMAEKILKLEKLRTLIIDRGIMKEEIEDEDFESMFTSLRKLRILSVSLERESRQFSVPASIGQLKHIRYLAINPFDFLKLILPSTFMKLYHMQVLDFGSCREFVFYPGQDMSNLINLRCILSNLPNIIRLTSLETLPNFRVRKEPGYELRQLRDLNKLRGRLEISGLENVGSKEEALEANLAGKEHLTRLELSWDRNRLHRSTSQEILDLSWDRNRFHRSTPVEILLSWSLQVHRSTSREILDLSWDRNRLHRITSVEILLSWALRLQSSSKNRLQSSSIQAEVLEGLCPPMGLETLRIDGYKGWRYPDWMIGKMNGPKHLQRLVLCDCSRLGAIPDRNEFFLHLITLTLKHCSWDALPDNMEEHLTSLKELSILGCENIRSLPTLPQSLEYLRISRCNDVFTRLCKTIGHPNWQKIQHVPKKYIGG